MTKVPALMIKCECSQNQFYLPTKESVINDDTLDLLMAKGVQFDIKTLDASPEVIADLIAGK